MVELGDRLRQWGIADESAMPLPGAGATAERHRRLLELGRQDLSLARIAEGHSDAVAILAEQGRAARPAALYGVWASEGPRGPVRASRNDRSGWRLDGVKPYCSGAPFVTSALVTAHSDDGIFLFDVPIDQPGIQILPSSWASPAMADTATGAVAFEAVDVPQRAAVGPAGWYLSRPGFWHGAIGPAACWSGGAIALVESAAALNRRDPHSRAQVGALQAAAWGMHAVLEQAGREIDLDPGDAKQHARTRALKVRHLIERWCTEILDRFGRATGPQLLAYDDQVARQHGALALYIRQCHGERDLETIPSG